MSIFDTLKKLGADLYENKPLFWAVIIAVAVGLFWLWQNMQQQSQAVAQSAGTMPIILNATFPEGPTIIQQTAATTSGGVPPPAPVPPTPSAPVPAPVVAAPPQTAPSSGNVGNLPPLQRTATVTPWPTQTSTLWGIAQKYYGNGTLWTRIYDANKAKIGSNPNLIHPGLVLVIP